jgi:hypothetical protein
MKLFKNPVSRSVFAIALSSLLFGCASGTQDANQSSTLSYDECKPMPGDRPGEYVVVNTSVHDAHHADKSALIDQIQVRTRLRDFSGSEDKANNITVVPFQNVMEQIYVSDVEFTESPSSAPVAKLGTSMFATGFGGQFAFNNRGETLNIRMKYRDAVLTRLDEISVSDGKGAEYKVQSPQIASVNRDFNFEVKKESGIVVNVYPGADKRSIVVHRCWYKVPS